MALALLLCRSSASAREKVYYFHNDHLGTPQAMTDQAGTVVWAAEYEPFGKATVTSATVTNNLRFPGQYYDAETGLHYNWHREYDPDTGRYLQPDPIGLGGGTNLYAYVSNNPVNRFDLLGLKECCPSGDAGQIDRRIAEVTAILSRLQAGILPGGNGTDEELGKTICWWGGNPTWRTKRSRGECVKDCLEEHEAVHGLQCITIGSSKYNNLSQGDKISLETRAYQVELDCLKAKKAAVR
jgi:RHS repeat-associated protein